MSSGKLPPCLDVFDIEYFHGKKTYKVCNKFIYKIIIDLPESSKITQFKDLFDKITEFKVTEKN